jgi:CheY-like chemotaxis protein
VMPEERHMMPNAKAKVLIVDDETSIRTSLSLILTTVGHIVRSVGDGFSALAGLRNDVPDILISDLNMPGMSGFELLSVVRRRFPTIQVIAMSGAFSGDSVPLGVAADVFYEKGSNPSTLLEKVKAMAQIARSSIRHSNTPTPIWIPKNGHDPTGAEYVMVSCPQCLRTFPQVLGGDVQPIREAGCAHCSSLIHYAIVQPVDTPSKEVLQRKPAAKVPASPGLRVEAKNNPVHH